MLLSCCFYYLSALFPLRLPLCTCTSPEPTFFFQLAFFFFFSLPVLSVSHLWSLLKHLHPFLSPSPHGQSASSIFCFDSQSRANKTLLIHMPLSIHTMFSLSALSSPASSTSKSLILRSLFLRLMCLFIITSSFFLFYFFHPSSLLLSNIFISL
ncbi:hypothetical protein BKA57DRAFT_47644 [Linnemannia elongata]|nr:hypothetical protein BKA57DRAFT_47644 [Linnemannia elongata]